MQGRNQKILLKTFLSCLFSSRILYPKQRKLHHKLGKRSVNREEKQQIQMQRDVGGNWKLFAITHEYLWSLFISCMCLTGMYLTSAYIFKEEVYIHWNIHLYFITFFHVCITKSKSRQFLSWQFLLTILLNFSFTPMLSLKELSGD